MSHASSPPRVARRRLLAAASGAFALSRVNIARAEPIELVVGTNGGEEYAAMYQAVYQRFEKKHNVKIVPVFGSNAVLLNRAIAEQNNPSMDATITYQGGWLIGEAEGVFEKIDSATIPRIDEVYDFLKDPNGYAPFVTFGAWGIVYNSDEVKRPPTSYKDLWKPEYRGQLMIGGIDHWQLHLAAFSQAWAGRQTDIETAFQKAKELAPNVAAFYGMSSDAQSKFEQSIGTVATWYSYTAQRLRNKGIPLQFQPPDEGAFLFPGAFQAIKGTKKLDLVIELIGAFYEPEACIDAARLNGYIPPNRNVRLDAELQKQILTVDQVQKAHSWDWPFINANQNAWLTRWNAEVRPLIHG
jgi:putative spermidine/putrescine transport system substrate-binding protein